MTVDRVMLLIDADNVSVDVMEQAVRLLLNQHGGLHVRRAYCTAESAVANQSAFKRLGIKPMVNLAAGKNSTDIALAVDAIDLVLAERPDVVVIASSDSDFAPLVHRLREKGCVVRGIGQLGKTGDETQEVYDDFTVLEHRKASAGDAARAAAADRPRRTPRKTAAKAPAAKKAPAGRKTAGRTATAPGSAATAPGSAATATEAGAATRAERPRKAGTQVRAEAVAEASTEAVVEAHTEVAPDASVHASTPAPTARPARRKAPSRTAAARKAAGGTEAPAGASAPEVTAAVFDADDDLPGAVLAMLESPVQAASAAAAGAAPAAPAEPRAPRAPSTLAAVLACLPELQAGQGLALNVAVQRLREAQLLGKNTSSLKLFSQLSDRFELLPPDKPSQVRLRA